MGRLSREIFERLSVPGSRLPWLREWLLGSVWTAERYEAVSPVDFLEQGEKEVNELEEVIAAAAPRIYDELLGNVSPEHDVRAFLDQMRPCAVVVFDGLSLREIPLLLKLAAESKLTPVEPPDFSFAAVPSETIDFIDQRLGVGRAAPSSWRDGKTVGDSGVRAYYYDSPSSSQRLDLEAEALLLWSSFPDQTYSDHSARLPQHFEQMHALMKTAWMHTIQRITDARTILVTSDHGYVYFGSNMNFPRTNPAVSPLTKYLGGERSARISETGSPPEHPDLLVLHDRDLAIIRGRVQTHPPGPASSKLYKHGGLSFMEMLTPWLVLRGESQ